MSGKAPSPSPVSRAPWSPTTKLIVGFTLVGLAFGALVVFRPYIAPLTLTVVLAYLLFPLCRWVHRYTRLSWRLTVTLVYLLLVALLLGLLTWFGFALSQQVQSLYTVVSHFITQDLPEFITSLSTSVYRFGPFELDFTRYNWETFSQQFLAAVQPLLGQVGVALRVVAARAASLTAWLLFVLLISYFLLAESNPNTLSWIPLNVLPDTARPDLERLIDELGDIWNTFLRGQFTAFVVMSATASVVLTLLDVRYSLGLALLVGLARFLPYIGPAFVYVVTTVVVLLQPGNFWGLAPWKHALIVVGILILMDQAYDNVVMPRFFGHRLGIHPATVLIAAVLLSRIIGFVGFMLAAPVVASGRLLLRYTFYKLLDLDPWSAMPLLPELPSQPWWKRAWMRAQAGWQTLQERLQERQRAQDGPE